jgi:error-prone DNA polymerase
MPYPELQVTTNFSFLRGASHPHELVATAAALGHSALAVTDRNSVAGLVRAHIAARELGLRLIPGCRLDFTDGTPSLLCYPADRAGYGRLCRLLSLGKRRAPKGDCHLALADLAAWSEGLLAVVVPPGQPDAAFAARLEQLKPLFPGRLHLGAAHLYRGDDARRLARLAALAARCRVPLVATSDILYHAPERRRLQDVLTCIREGCTIDAAGLRLEANAERHLKPPAEMARLFRRHPEALENARALAERCAFSLDELAYEYPDEITPDGEPAQQRLERLTREGIAWRYPEGAPQKVLDQIDRELDLIARRNYAPFFLTVEDVVRHARHLGILHQGRGSAANSAVCFMLGITSVDPARHSLLFERFISEARNEPPDIDVDFEHERREEIIQYIYGRFGRHRAGLTATVICYRSRGAMREVGRAMGLSEDTLSSLAGAVRGWGQEGVAEDDVRERGLDPADDRLRLALDLARELIGFPRHLSQHPGGFVITRGRLDELVPVENAAMQDRTLICWDKDDIDALGMLKVDVLALGMLTCIRKAFDLLKAHYGIEHTLASIPAEDPAVYDMLCRADSVGVFQVESRAQQTMLPRLRPRTFYDLVIEVAIVRPGPIQGDMVHPYLRRRQGLEPVRYEKDELRGILGKTLGVPLFQEQCMQLAITAAGFSPADADRLRRAMATFRAPGTIHQFESKFIGGMVERGYDRSFAERCFAQIKGFGTYGFPESHACSFALLVYVSAWLKCHYPDVFCAAILNSQPMGFYAPAQLVRDARGHGVEVRAADVNHSAWDHTLEADGAAAPARHAVRLGFRLVAGLRPDEIARLVETRTQPYDSAEALARTGLLPATLRLLAEADAFGSLALDRRPALWAMRGVDHAPPPLLAEAGRAATVTLPPMPPSQSVAEDYASTGLSLRRHPLSFLRGGLRRRGMVRAEELRVLPNHSRVAIAGLVLFRQRPETASGVIFATLEDETGTANLIIWPAVAERHRAATYGAKLMACRGRLQREAEVIHVVADTILDWSSLLRRLADPAGTEPAAEAQRPMRVISRDFR